MRILQLENHVYCMQLYQISCLKRVGTSWSISCRPFFGKSQQLCPGWRHYLPAKMIWSMWTSSPLRMHRRIAKLEHVHAERVDRIRYWNIGTLFLLKLQLLYYLQNLMKTRFLTGSTLRYRVLRSRVNSARAMVTEFVPLRPDGIRWDTSELC